MSGEARTFKSRILASATLTTFRFASEVVLRLISTIVLTRLLSPDVYGVFALVLVYLYILEMFSDLGFRTLVLTKEDDADADFLRTCWTLSIVRGAVIFACAALIGVVISLIQSREGFAPDSAYSAAALPWAIAALGAGSLLTGFQSPMRWVSERRMEFGRVTAVDVSCNILTLVATIVLAIYLRSVWALVIGNLLRAVLFVTLSFVVFPGPRMRLSLHRSHLSLLISRGKWIVSTSIFTALSQSADRLVLGFVMTSDMFGFYFIARQLVDILTRFLATLNAQMEFQVFTHLQKSAVADFRRNYYRYRLFFDAFAGLSAGLLIVLAPWLVGIVFDDRYGAVAPIAQLLAPAVLLIGPLLLRSAYGAERRFKRTAVLGAMSMIVLWAGLALAVIVFQSVPAALLVIALHRLPEALAYTAMGWQRGWVILWREPLGLIFLAVGALAGWGFLTLWAAMT